MSNGLANSETSSKRAQVRAPGVGSHPLSPSLQHRRGAVVHCLCKLQRCTPFVELIEAEALSLAASEANVVEASSPEFSLV